ncbi:head GIN domain-containing protein [Dysgonomonas macrotermitis]|uniref:Putative auto-transporter adhesin, head GIN domain n=1 Tax=Dysgonomonas macrotermitis TaxID=1346286 RepID=A0A1M5GR49_9BACT|nr:head GIN domain-containing protein [Dysgonomonas macrotermitis]SHG06138.1 Putative auto-transporter adhesin, head GIN domain [Dysgonomonas macrotermitis]
MKKQTLLLALFCILSITVYAQNIVSQKRQVSSFSGIKVCCAINVYITEGNSPSITVSANGDIIDKVITEVKNNVLSISVNNNKKKKFGRNDKIEVYVTASNLNLIEASSGSDIYGKSLINANIIKLNASSAGSIKLDLKANTVKCDASSGGDINLTGSANNAEATASSGGDVKMKGMIVLTASASASSGGDVSITVKNEIKASASSGGDVVYYGNPAKVAKSASSGGGVKKK